MLNNLYEKLATVDADEKALQEALVKFKECIGARDLTMEGLMKELDLYSNYINMLTRNLLSMVDLATNLDIEFKEVVEKELNYLIVKGVLEATDEAEELPF